MVKLIHTSYNIIIKMVDKRVKPEVWKQMVSKFSNEFCPRMIFKFENQWLWQADDNTTIDISNWLLNWNVDGKNKLMTMEEFLK